MWPKCAKVGAQNAWVLPMAFSEKKGEKISRFFHWLQKGTVVRVLPSGKHFQKTNWKDPPFSSWVNPLFNYGHFTVRYFDITRPGIEGNSRKSTGGSSCQLHNRFVSL